jgi:tetratricopeptide (TPR) repeat protein
LDAERYFPFVIRDTDRAFDAVPEAMTGIAQFPLAAVNLELRAAAYELSYLNLIGSSGPTQLCMFMRSVRCLIFNLGVPGWHDTMPKAYRENYGIEPGSQLPHATRYQRLVWGADDAPTIAKYFGVMTRFIEGGLAGLGDDLERAFIEAPAENAEVFAERMFAGRQWGPCKTIYRHLLSRKPDDAELTYRLGVAETWAGNPSRGMELLQRALDLGYETAALYLARCEALMFLRRPDQAAANARLALEHDPQSFDSAMRLGLLYESHGQLNDARTWIERAVAMRPESSEAHAFLSSIKARAEQLHV